MPSKTSKPHMLREIATERRSAEARFMRKALFDRCREMVAELGDDVSGFAMVIWTRNGELRSAYDTGFGPLRSAVVPTLVSDALNRHVAQEMAPPRRPDDDKSV